MQTAEHYRRLGEDCLLRACACQDKVQQAEWFKIAQEWLTLANARATMENRASQPSLSSLDGPGSDRKGCRSG